MTGDQSAIRNGILWGYLSQATSIVLSVISLPLLLGLLDQELFSIWTIIAGVVGYLSLSTLGIPTAASVLAAKLSDNRSKFEVMKKSFQWLLFFSLFALTIVYSCQIFFPNWVTILGDISSENISVTKQATLVMAFGLLLRAPFSLSLSGFAAQQRVDIVKKYELLATIALFCSLYLTVETESSIVFLAWSTASSALFVSLISFVHYLLLYWSKGQSVTSSDETTSIDILKTGISYFQIGFASMLVWASDAIIISNVLTSEAVAPYAIAFRLYSMGFILFTMINGVLIPSIGKARAEEDWTLIRKLHRLQISLLPAVAGTVWIGGILLGAPIIELWTGRDDMFGGHLLTFFLGLYGFILSHVSSYASVMTALNYSGRMSKFAWMEALIKVALSILLVRYIGISGAALGTVLASFLIPFLLSPVALNQLTGGKFNGHTILLAGKQLATIIPFLIFSVVCTIYITSYAMLCLFVLIFLAAYLHISYRLLEPETRELILASQVVKRIIR